MTSPTALPDLDAALSAAAIACAEKARAAAESGGHGVTAETWASAAAQLAFAAKGVQTGLPARPGN